MGREENIVVFQDTANQVQKNKRLKEAVEHSTANQKLILENDELTDVDNSRYETKAQVVVSKKRSFEAASAYKGMKTCVHNFASASNPGGGVVHGSSAQEEALCRCSSLYFSLNTKAMWEGFYGPHRAMQDPLHNDDIIYTPGVVVFKTDTYSPKMMAEEDWYSVDIITCAAPNLRNMPSNMMNAGDGSKAAKISDTALYDLHAARLRRILDVAAAEGEEVVILGAFGCGAFENNPKVVARAAADIVSEYMNCFKTIEFAIYCSERDTRNYTEFNKALAKYTS